MRDILTEIVASKYDEVLCAKASIPLNELIAASRDMPPVISMSQALKESKSGIIAEFKRRSPSKGWIKESANASIIPPSYAAAGAAALSILSDRKYFGGSLRDIETARPLVNIPILRKEFVVDEYQLYEARRVGADAILLIAAALTPNRCSELIAKAHEIGLEVLLELHDQSEVDYIEPSVEMVGINNRNLGSFHTDVDTSYRLSELLPEGAVHISESGISSSATVCELRKIGYRGFLIGENFMRTETPGDTLAEFIKSVESYED
ncbi:MAG: indole-3-glycerol phosphate synthase TrpC [Rikenellaceae bacterium]